MSYENATNPYSAYGSNPYVAPYGSSGAPPQQQQSAYARLRESYRRMLGREPSDSELESHLQGRYDDASVQRAAGAVAYSPEAQQRQVQNQSAPPAATTTPPPATTTGGVPPSFTRQERDQLTWGNTGRMEGFEVGSTYGGDLKARNSVKNTFGRIASRYPATPEGLRQAMQDPEFQRAFPNARLIDHPTGDKIDFGGVLSDFETGSPVGVVDVGRSFAPNQTEQTAWVWQPEDTSSSAYQRTQAAILNGGGQNQTQPEGSPTRVSDAVLNTAGGEEDPITQYLAYLQSLLQPPSL